jgi:F-type H+-transporting ATPase subunit b
MSGAAPLTGAARAFEYGRPMAEANVITVEDAAAPGATTTTQHEGAGEGGLPQFQIQHWGGQIGYLLILFAILYVLVSKVYAPRIRRIFDERAAAITGALASARQVQTEAATEAAAAEQALNDARAQAGRTASEAKAKSAAETQERQSALEAELNAKLGEAEQRIRASRDAAMLNVQSIAADTAQAIVKKLTGVAASGDAVKAAVASLEG